MPDKKLIKIISIPDGPGIPEIVRKGWIGCVFEAEGPSLLSVGSVVNPGEDHGSHQVYTTPSELALMVLKYHNIDSWHWFIKQNMLACIFCFNTDSCKEL